MSSTIPAKERVAVITGGGSGLGLATAKRFVAMDYQVRALGKTLEEAMVDSRFQYRDFDVTDGDAVANFAASLDVLDVLVNAAGIIAHDGVEFEPAGFERVMNVNINGTYLMCLACHEALKKRKGCVVNFASLWSLFGSGRNPAYSASKGAVLQLTRSLAVAWAADGIRVNAVIPGWIRTRMSERAMSDPERSVAILSRIPMRCWGEPDSVAAVIEFLASEGAAYVTGAAIPIDGGYSIA